MSKRILLDHDETLGCTQYVHPDEDGVTVETEWWGTQRVLDENHGMRGVNGEAPKGTQTWGHHVARVPMEVMTAWFRKYPIIASGTHEGNAKLLALIRDRDYSQVRTYDGRI